jgi:O-acetyl-ADP-ribose deacetylase
MEEPAQPTNSESIKRAVRAALEEASSLNVNFIAFPGMGTGVGKVSKKKAAMVMVGAIKDFLSDYSKFEKIFLVAIAFKCLRLG